MSCTTGLAIAKDEAYAEPDWVGMRRDLYSLIGWQVAATAIIYHAPFEYSNWNEEEKDNLGFEQWRKNVTDPTWDKDHWAVNYVLHPYWGAGYYVRGRERGFSRQGSFWIAVFYSSVYEFGVESFLEQPSVQDLIVTPVAGVALGLWFDNIRGRIRSRSRELRWTEKFILGVTDPLGALNQGVARLFGIETNSGSTLSVNLRPVLAARESSRNVQPPGTDVKHGGRKFDGLELTFHYRW